MTLTKETQSYIKTQWHTLDMLLKSGMLVPKYNGNIRKEYFYNEEVDDYIEAESKDFVVGNITFGICSFSANNVCLSEIFYIKDLSGKECAFDVTEFED